MSKAILVVNEIPNYCINCSLQSLWFGERICWMTKFYLGDVGERPLWCPLKEIDDEVLKQLGIEDNG